MIQSVIRIPCQTASKFFLYWFQFLKPISNLTNRETEIVAALVFKRYELSKVIQDEDILNRVLMSDTTKKEIREECDITQPHFQVIISKLKKNNIIKDNKINPRYLPDIKEDTKSFKMLFLFDFES